MSGLLAADGIVARHHFLQNMPVPYCRADQIDPFTAAEFMQAEIRHHRGHHSVIGQLSAAAQFHTAHGHDLISVNGMPLFIHQQTTVRITVESDAKLILSRHRHGGKLFKMRGAAAIVDVDAVRVNVDEIRHYRQPLKEIRSRSSSCAVGTVHQYPQPRQVTTNSGKQVVDIVRVHFLRTVAAAAQFTAGLDRHFRMVQDQLLHPLLHGVRQLIPLPVEHLDAVILIRIMAGGNDHAGIRLFLYGQKRYRRRGNGAQQQYVTAYGTNAGDKRRLQHIR